MELGLRLLSPFIELLATEARRGSEVFLYPGKNSYTYLTRNLYFHAEINLPTPMLLSVQITIRHLSAAPSARVGTGSQQGPPALL
jgi:hypothetical protein